MNERKYKNLLLICASGITTGLLVRSIEKNIQKDDLPIHVFSAPSIIAKQIIKEDDVDAILIGPHIAHEITRLQELLNHEDIAYRLIDRQSYQLLDGKSILKQGMNLLDLN